MIILRRTATVRSQAIWQAVATAALTFLAVHFDITAVIALHVLRAMGFAVFNGRTVNRALNIPSMLVWRALAPPIVSSIFMVLATLGVTRLLAGAPPLWVLVSAVPAGALIFAGAIAAGDGLGLWRGYLRDLIGFFGDALKPSPQPGRA
jgi:hypothetical protein